MSSPLLQVRDLAVAFDTNEGRVEAVRGVSFDVGAGEFVGVVGESGCGKSVTSRALIAMVDRPGRITEGSVLFEGQDVLRMDEQALRSVRGRRISMVFQDPMTSLNPVFTIGQQLEFVMRAHGNAGGGCPSRGTPARRRDPGPRQASRSIPSRVVGRDATARHDRHGSGEHPRAGHS